jgi:hypothetical protein
MGTSALQMEPDILQTLLASGKFWRNDDSFEIALQTEEDGHQRTSPYPQRIAASSLRKLDLKRLVIDRAACRASIKRRTTLLLLSRPCL